MGILLVAILLGIVGIAGAFVVEARDKGPRKWL